MDKRQFDKAVKIATSMEAGNFNNMHIFDGFALKDYKPVLCHINDMAGLIHWQAVNFDGSINAEALAEIWQNKSKFIVTGY
jgi:hypothetical protein